VQRTYAEFADRHGLPSRAFTSASPRASSNSPRGFLGSAVEAATQANGALASLQDTMLPVEVGDAELRAGLEDVRQLLGDIRVRAREFARTLGR